MVNIHISVALHKTAVSPVLMHWRYCRFVQSHWNNLWNASPELIVVLSFSSHISRSIHIHIPAVAQARSAMTSRWFLMNGVWFIYLFRFPRLYFDFHLSKYFEWEVRKSKGIDFCIDGLMQNMSFGISSALVMEIPQFCSRPSMRHSHQCWKFPVWRKDEHMIIFNSPC